MRTLDRPACPVSSRTPSSLHLLYTLLSCRTWWHCEDQGLRFLQCFQHHEAHSAGSQDGVCKCGAPPQSLYSGLLDRSRAVSEDVGTVKAPFPFPFYTTDFTHNITTCHLQKCHYGLTQLGEQRIYMGFVDVATEPPPYECGENQGSGNVFCWASLLSMRRGCTDL